jgi:ADP-heptose:LPS heptosyltransferase
LKALIIRPAALGDTLMLMPAVSQLRASAKITLVGRQPGIYFLRPYIDLCIDFEGPGWHSLFLDRMDDVHRMGNVHRLSIPKVDRIAAFLSDPDGVVSQNLKTHHPATPFQLFPAFPPKGAKGHTAYYLAQCLQTAGLPIDPGESLEEAFRRPLLAWEDASNARKTVVLHPGSGGRKKNHPPDFWLELIEALRRGLSKERYHFILLLGPAEMEEQPFFRKNLIHNETEILCSPEKERLLPHLKEADIYIGHDSGITHLAAMLGTPTIALFKNSSAHQWGPLGPVVRVIKTEEKDPDLIFKVLNEGKKLLASTS